MGNAVKHHQKVPIYSGRKTHTLVREGFWEEVMIKVNLGGLSHMRIERWAHCKVTRDESGGDSGPEEASRRPV